MNLKQDTRGYTVLEILVVITMIGILSAVFLANQKGKEDSAKLHTLAADNAEIVKAANAWRENQGSALFTGISAATLVSAGLYSTTTNCYGGAITVGAANNDRAITITQGGITTMAVADNLVTLLTARGATGAAKSGSGPYSVAATY